MIDLSIIVPTLNNAQDNETRGKINYSLTQCLTSLQETVPDVPLVVASNKGDPNPLPVNFNGSWKNSKFSRVHLFEQGQCKAVNAAVASTNTEWIMITNDDMIYAPGWLEKLTKDLGEVNDFMCATLVEPQKGAPPFLEYFCGGAGGDFDKQKWLEFATSHESNKTERGFNLPFIIKRELWDLIGGYDINYDPWGSNSDSDLQAKIHLSGSLTLRDRNCLVYHFSQTSGTFHPSVGGFWDKNWNYFTQKWGFERQRKDVVWYSEELIDYDKLIYKPKWAVIPD